MDRITLHDFKRLMKGRPKEGMTAFIQSSPGLMPTLADPSLIPSLSAEHGLSNVMEEDPELVESLNEQAEIEKTVLADEIVIKWLEGQPVKKFILVKGRIVNVVV